MKFVSKKDLRFRLHNKDSHKGDNGRVLIVGGSREYVGAVALAGIAALRAGCDSVLIATPEKVAWAINCMSPDLMTVKLKGEYLKKSHVKQIILLGRKSDVMLIGNGLGGRKETAKAIKDILRQVKIPKVIDADAIKAIRIQEASNSILTPHQKEFEILCKNSRLKPQEIRASLGTNVLIIKGRIDRIMSEKKMVYNKTGNQGMTKAGTGDVLAGLCAGLVAQGIELFAAAKMAAYINGLTGDLEKKKRGYSFIASDLLRDIKNVRQNGTTLC
ncbi:MAG: NAD(P)H-hydrate dehydratase [Candidatus Woesearchaeota archaeon]